MGADYRRGSAADAALLESPLAGQLSVEVDDAGLEDGIELPQSRQIDAAPEDRLDARGHLRAALPHGLARRRQRRRHNPAIAGGLAANDPVLPLGAGEDGLHGLRGNVTGTGEGGRADAALLLDGLEQAELRQGKPLIAQRVLEQGTIALYHAPQVLRAAPLLGVPAGAFRRRCFFDHIL